MPDDNQYQRVRVVNFDEQGKAVGSTGADRSANKPVVTGDPLLTINANTNRVYVEVQNQSAAQIQVVRDDGAGSASTVILLAPGAGANQQGGSWASATFKGRVRVYGAAGAQVAAYED